jgi:hypothetical protein
VQGLQIAEEDSPLERSEPAALESRRAGEIDVKDGRRRRLEREAQALAPLVEMRCDPFELLRREIAGVGERQERIFRNSRSMVDGAPIASSRTGSRSKRSAHARENGVKSSVHFAAVHRSQR